MVPLLDLDTEELDTRVHTFLEALNVVGTGDFTERLGAQAALRRTLGWLWDVVAEPVLDELGHTAIPAAGAPWPRVWWSPTGPLNFLPLHAAERYQAQDGYAVLDRVVSSYAPTIRALLHARRRSQPPEPAFGLPDPHALLEGAGDLPHPGTTAD